MKLITVDGNEYDIETVNVINIKPGDVLVFQCKERISRQQAAVITEGIKTVFPHNEVMILENGAELGVLHKC